MVLPNALLAFYYTWRRRPEITYASQVGDGHVCIPLCVGIYALHHPLFVAGFFQTGVIVLAGATMARMFCVVALGGLPRLMGAVLLAAYGGFVKTGFGRRDVHPRAPSGANRAGCLFQADFSAKICQ